MKKHLLFISVLLLTGLTRLKAGDNPPASLSGTYLVGSSQPVYKKLKDVALALNNASNSVTGNVIYELDSDYDGTTGETFPIVFNQFTSTGNWTVTIRPRLGTTQRKTIGAGVMITLDGADRIIFDGRPGGTGSSTGWLIRTTWSGIFDPAIQLINDAQSNTFTWLQLEGQNTDWSSPLIYIGATNKTQGNDNNTISYCTIRDRSDITGIPSAGIASYNPQATTGNSNSGLVITHNNFINIYSLQYESISIFLSQGTTDATVTFNSFFQTHEIVCATPGIYVNAVRVDGLNASNIVISNNYMGGTEPECGGNPFVLKGSGENAGRFKGISFINTDANGTGHKIENNTMRNFEISMDESPTTSFEVFNGIEVSGSKVDVTNNTMGSSTGQDDIKVTLHSTTWLCTPTFISFTSRYGGSITGNKMGGLSINGDYSGSSSGIIRGIKAEFMPVNSSSPFTISDNVIGSLAVTDNIHVASPAMGFDFIGISAKPSGAPLNVKNNIIAGVLLEYSDHLLAPGIVAINCSGWGTAVVDSNTISDISVAGTEVSGSKTFQGILCGNDVSFVRNNTIRHLHLTGTAPAQHGFSGSFSGIFGIVINASGSMQATIGHNQLYDFTSANNPGSSISTILEGINFTCNALVYNNTISLTNGANTNNCEIHGIVATGLTNKLYHNAVYIGGSNATVSDPVRSYAIGRSAYQNGLQSRNNLLVNERTGGNASHYIYYNNAATNAATNWSSDYNVMITGHMNTVGKWGASDLDSAQWRANSDANSQLYPTAWAGASDLFANSALELKPDARKYVAGAGVSGTGITTDLKGKIRHADIPTAGAYEYPVAVLKNLVISEGILSPGFQRPVNEYADTVTDVVSALTVTPVALDPASTIKINGVAVNSGQASGNIALNFGVNTITVGVTSADGTTSNTYTVKVTRDNGIPNNAPTDLLLSSATITENSAAGSVVGTLTATDPDPGNSFTYALVTGDSSADNASFTIDGDQLKINSSPDYETKSSYSIRVRVTDAGSLFVEKGFIITVTDVNDNAPVITSHNGAGSLSLNAEENQTTVTTVTATDADGSTLSYSIVNGEDGTYFTVNGTTGVLTFNTAPDFERPGDPDENNMYTVTVQVSDGLFTAMQRFKVRVTNINDNAPEFGSYDGDAAVILKIPENTTAVGTVWAIDKEPGTTITYSIVNNQEGARFSINPVTGVLTFITAPDYENPTDEFASNVYIVTVQASDGELASYQRFKVKITDVNEGAGRMSNLGVAIQQVITEEETGKGIKAYPNPVTGRRFTLQIDSVAAGRYTLEIYATNGQLVWRQQLDHTGKRTLYPVQLPPTLLQGMYILRLTGIDTKYTGKLLID